MLVSNRICLSEIEEEDLALLVKWRNDIENLRGLFSYLPLNLQKQRNWFQKYCNEPSSQLFMIELVKENEKIGVCGLNSIDYRNQRAELSIIIGENSYKGKGYASEALSLLHNYAFNYLNLKKIFLQVLITNDSAISLYKKMGYQQEGLLKGHYFQDGKFVDVLLMSIFNTDGR